MTRLHADFYARDTLTVARELVGRYLLRRLNGAELVCRITETEAYIGAVDKACHAYGGRRTPRTETLYAAPGTSYVYLIYGMYCCLNLVTEAQGTAAAVLIRGAVPVRGIDEITGNRFGIKAEDMTANQRKNFLNGPGKLCMGLGITRAQNGLDVENNELVVCNDIPELGLAAVTPEIRVSKRIGIDYAQEAADFPWRFYEPV
jgi:DNA-3-methyladenine glycosylase